jgi:hypothetical protein
MPEHCWRGRQIENESGRWKFSSLTTEDVRQEAANRIVDSPFNLTYFSSLLTSMSQNQSDYLDLQVLRD